MKKLPCGAGQKLVFNTSHWEFSVSNIMYLRKVTEDSTNFPKPGSHLQIVGARRVSSSRLHIEGP
jgi:hypothetical protein